jgi:lysophospholipase L1-like esterase
MSYTPPLYGPQGGASPVAIDPAQLPGAVFRLDPMATSKFAFVGGAIDTASHNGIVLAAPAAGRRPVFDESSTLNGKRCIRLTAAGSPSLESAASIVTGDDDHWLMLVAQGRATPDNYKSIILYGQTGVVNSVLGEELGGNWWAGGKDKGGPTAPYTSAPTILTKVHAGGVDYFYRYGVLIASTPSTYALGPGFGLTLWSPSFPTPEVNVFDAVWGVGALSHAQINSAVAHYRSADGFLLQALARKIICLGDSITYGYNLAVGELPYPAQLQALLLSRFGVTATVINSGVSGKRTDELFALLDQIVFQYHSPMERDSVVVIEAGPNDIAQGVPAATIITNLKNLCASCRLFGLDVVLMTIPPVVGTESAAQTTVNNWVRAHAVQDGFALAIVDLYRQDDGYGDLTDAANHLPGDAVHPDEGGDGIIANRTADVVVRFLS